MRIAVAALPGITHGVAFRDCPACREDHEALRALVSGGLS
jgi:hypothetical protein